MVFAETKTVTLASWICDVLCVWRVALNFLECNAPTYSISQSLSGFIYFFLKTEYNLQSGEILPGPQRFTVNNVQAFGHILKPCEDLENF